MAGQDTGQQAPYRGELAFFIVYWLTAALPPP